MRQTEPVKKESEPATDRLLALLREMCPECIVEGKVDFDKLRAALGDVVD
ncbi:hypothetical protein GX586_10085, partial [bacterium]|nr:hypothetical protein [bacterium]